MYVGEGEKAQLAALWEQMKRNGELVDNLIDEHGGSYARRQRTKAIKK